MQRTDEPFTIPKGRTNMFNLLHVYLMQLVNRFRNERGELSIEYVLIAGLVSVVILAGMTVLTPAIGTWFTNIASRVSGATPAP